MGVEPRLARMESLYSSARLLKHVISWRGKYISHNRRSASTCNENTYFEMGFQIIMLVLLWDAINI